MRLTKNINGMVWFASQDADLWLEPNEMSYRDNRIAIDKLATYEDAEEQGRLVILPFDMKGIKLVVAERERQIDLWCDQSGNHPFEWMAILGEEYGELCEAVNETCFQNPKHPERGGKPNIVKEAVHVASVAIAIAEDVLKRGQDDD